MKHVLAKSIVALLLGAFVATPLSAQTRFALLVGNENYSQQVGTLKNPHNDIMIVGDALSKANFSVVSRLNLSRSGILREVTEYAERLSNAGPNAIGFFYYSGHGVSRPLNHINYLIPTDIPNLQDQNFWFNAVSLDDILNELENGAPNASHIIVFDACRNELHLPTKSAVKGFQPVTDRNGMFVAFSTSPNTSSSDIGDNGGPYARILGSEIGRVGQDHLSLFQNVKERVFSATDNVQRPWENNGLLERVYLAGKPAPQEQPSPDDEAKRLWDSFGQRTTDAKFLEDFISRYGQTAYGPLAKKRLADVGQQVTQGNMSATSILRSKIVRAIVPNSDSYVSGEMIRIKIIAASSRVKAFAVFPFGARERAKVEAGYNVAEGGLYIPYKVPPRTAPGVYSVAVYVQEIESKIEERHDIDIAIK
jgi:uncharacterized caspase-like protein